MGLGLIGVSACASLPDAEIGYYLPKPELDITVTRTLACDSDKKIQSVTTPTITLSHVADYDNWQTFTLDDYGGTFADGELTFNFYNDGRLKGINTSSTGKGKAIIEGAVKLGLGIAGGGVKLDGAPKHFCDFIDNQNTTKTTETSVTFVYTGRAALADGNSENVPLYLTRESLISQARFISDPIEPSMNDLFGELSVELSAESIPTGNRYKLKSENDTDVIKLSLNNIAQRRVKVISTGSLPLSEECPVDPSCTDGAQNALPEQSITLAARGKAKDKLITIGIPKPALFGSTEFELALSEAGDIQKLRYKIGSGAADAIDLANAIDDATSGSSYSDKAAEVKAQADLIVQQQRLANCLADKTNCE